MVQITSSQAYHDILKELPSKTRPVYAAIFANPGICIGEIGQMLNMQNSSVSGRVNDLIDALLVYYMPGTKKTSPITRKLVLMLQANDVFNVDPTLIKYAKPKVYFSMQMDGKNITSRPVQMDLITDQLKTTKELP